MSQALEVYLIPNKKDLQVFGCRRRKLLEGVLEAGAEELEDLDVESDVESEGFITHADALKEIFTGELSQEEECGYIYGHAYEVYCRAIGARLSNKHFSPTSVEWLEKIDAFLKEQELPISFKKLLFVEFPIPVETDATPCGGWWDHKEIAKASPLMKPAIGAADKEVADALRVVQGWLEEAMKTPRGVIVGFFD